MYDHQRGITLVVAMLVVFVLSTIGVSAMSVSQLEQRMGRNFQDSVDVIIDNHNNHLNDERYLKKMIADLKILPTARGFYPLGTSPPAPGLYKRAFWASPENYHSTGRVGRYERHGVVMEDLGNAEITEKANRSTVGKKQDRAKSSRDSDLFEEYVRALWAAPPGGIYGGVPGGLVVTDPNIVKLLVGEGPRHVRVYRITTYNSNAEGADSLSQGIYLRKGGHILDLEDLPRSVTGTFVTDPKKPYLQFGPNNYYHDGNYLLKPSEAIAANDPFRVSWSQIELQ